MDLPYVLLWSYLKSRWIFCFYYILNVLGVSMQTNYGIKRISRVGVIHLATKVQVFWWTIWISTCLFYPSTLRDRLWAFNPRFSSALCWRCNSCRWAVWLFPARVRWSTWCTGRAGPPFAGIQRKSGWRRCCSSPSGAVRPRASWSTASTTRKSARRNARKCRCRRPNCFHLIISRSTSCA